MIKCGVEVVFDVMVEVGILFEFVYYELLYEMLFIFNIIVCKCLYEMNVVILDIVEYGNYLFVNVVILILCEKFMFIIDISVIGKGLIVVFN